MQIQVDHHLATWQLAFCVLGGTAVSFGSARLCRLLRAPPVYGMLGCGFLLRQVLPSEELVTVTDPIVDISLAAIGLEIGSHLNEQTLGPLIGQIGQFMWGFTMTVLSVVALGVHALMPTMVPFAALAASIAVERSSPECLHGITEARASGPLSSMLMCVAALQDIAAILCFVLTSVILGSTSMKDGVIHLLAMFACTAVSSGVGLLLAWRLGKYPKLAVCAVCVALYAIGEQTPSELLLSAIACGVVLNYKKKHPVTEPLGQWNGAVCAALFVWMGYRMDVTVLLGLSTHTTTTTPAISFTSNLLVVAAFYVVRLVALCLGSAVGGMASGLRQHLAFRWMGMVTQLAIALSLVQRAERAFPFSAPLMRVYGGSVLLSLATGPPLLQLALHLAKEAGVQRVGAPAVPAVTAAQQDDEP